MVKLNVLNLRVIYSHFAYHHHKLKLQLHQDTVQTINDPKNRILQNHLSTCQPLHHPLKLQLHQDSTGHQRPQK